MTNQELWEKADSLAVLYYDFEKNARKLTTKFSRMVEDALESNSKKKFIEANIPIIINKEANHEKLSIVIEDVNSMPEDSFRYFLTLVKFRYFFNKAKIKGVENE